MLELETIGWTDIHASGSFRDLFTMIIEPIRLRLCLWSLPFLLAVANANAATTADAQADALLSALNTRDFVATVRQEIDDIIRRRVAESETPFGADDLRVVEEVRAGIAGVLQWEQLRPDLVQYCIAPYDTAEIADMTAFYRTRHGRALVRQAWEFKLIQAYDAVPLSVRKVHLRRVESMAGAQRWAQLSPLVGCVFDVIDFRAKPWGSQLKGLPETRPIHDDGSDGES